MVYVSGDSIPQKIKKEITQGVYRDVFKVICSKCFKQYISEISYKLTCPYCQTTINSVKIPDGSKFDKLEQK